MEFESIFLVLVNDNFAQYFPLVKRNPYSQQLGIIPLRFPNYSLVNYQIYLTPASSLVPFSA